MKAILTGCADFAGTIKRLIMVAYYYLTIALPRRLPRNMDEYSSMQVILLQYYGLKDDPMVWAIVADRVQSPKPTSIRISYRSIVNPTKRVFTNKVAQDFKLLAYAEINARLEAQAKETAEVMKREEQRKIEDQLTHAEPGSDNHIKPHWSEIGQEQPVPAHDLSSGLQILPENKVRVVPTFESGGIQRY